MDGWHPSLLESSSHFSLHFPHREGPLQHAPELELNHRIHCLDLGHHRYNSWLGKALKTVVAATMLVVRGHCRGRPADLAIGYQTVRHASIGTQLRLNSLVGDA